MSNVSSMVLIGVGTSGCAIARGVSRAFGDDLRYVLADTDAKSNEGEGAFVLLGGARLSGRGAGGNMVNARLAAGDSVSELDSYLEGARLAVIVTSLGGGTGSGATYEVVKHLGELGIPSIVFATLPFQMEGDDRALNARGIISMIEEVANATFFLPLDKLVVGVDQMNEALKRAVDTVASGVTLFWRLVEKPGYIRLDSERIRGIISVAGNGRFASVSAQGENRAAEAVDKIIRSELLAAASSPVGGILCGVMAGDDLRLSEVQQIADGVRETFGTQLQFNLGVVNDEAVFGGRISVVVMLFEQRENATASSASGKARRQRGSLGFGPSGRGRFNNAEPTIWHGEDLDIPTFIRRNIDLDI